MRIYFLRHGDAAADPSLHDSERPLTELGRRQANTVAQFFRRTSASITLIFCSPLLRAQQTAQPVREQLGVKNLVLTEYLVPGNDPRQLLEQINARQADSILLVGHEPLLSELIAMLVAGGTELRIEIKKSSVALVETTPPIRRGHGLLKWLIHIDHLQQLE